MRAKTKMFYIERNRKRGIVTAVFLDENKKYHTVRCHTREEAEFALALLKAEWLHDRLESELGPGVYREMIRLYL